MKCSCKHQIVRFECIEEAQSNRVDLLTAVFSPGFFEGIVGGGEGSRERSWEKSL